MVAEFESDLIRMRTKEGLAVARANGQLRGRKPKLSSRQEAHLVERYHSGELNPSELAQIFNVGRATIYRAIERDKLRAVRAAEATTPHNPSSSQRI